MSGQEKCINLGAKAVFGTIAVGLVGIGGLALWHDDVTSEKDAAVQAALHQDMRDLLTEDATNGETFKLNAVFKSYCAPNEPCCTREKPYKAKYVIKEQGKVVAGGFLCLPRPDVGL